MSLQRCRERLHKNENESKRIFAPLGKIIFVPLGQRAWPQKMQI
jgi:hypothetical protein